MSELETYLDQVCRGIAGPRSLRQHIRQELREHLLDAAEQYRSSGLSQEEAVAKALEDFGGPEQVRAELAATHGQRLMAVVIDKAMQWKERTMKAKWLWTTWAHAALLLVIAAEVAFVAMAVTFIVPKHMQMAANGMFGPDTEDVGRVIRWLHGFLADVVWAMRNVWWWVVPLAAAWLLFEWRNRSEHKAMVRLSLMGLAALLLMPVVMLTGAALVLPPTLAMPWLEFRQPEPIVEAQVTELDAAVQAMEQELAKTPTDWDAVHREASRAMEAVSALHRNGAAGLALALRDRPQTSLKARDQLGAARAQLRELQQAVRSHNASRAQEAMKRFDEAYGPATRPAR